LPLSYCLSTFYYCLSPITSLLLPIPFMNFLSSLSNLFFPSICPGCNTQHINEGEMICMDCHHNLPYTGFEHIENNPVEKLFWGRTNIKFACSTLYYIIDSPIQHIIHHIKYRGQEELGVFMGELMGNKLHPIFKKNEIDFCLPMPLHYKKEYSRGYNQASLLCAGIKKTTLLNYYDRLITREINTSTQTKKTRIERWENVEDIFNISNQSEILDKNIVIIDDVITTGASTEACASVLLKYGAKSVGICGLAYTI